MEENKLVIQQDESGPGVTILPLPAEAAGDLRRSNIQKLSSAIETDLEEAKAFYKANPNPKTYYKKIEDAARVIYQQLGRQGAVSQYWDDWESNRLIRSGESQQPDISITYTPEELVRDQMIPEIPQLVASRVIQHEIPIVKKEVWFVEGAEQAWKELEELNAPKILIPGAVETDGTLVSPLEETDSTPIVTSDGIPADWEERYGPMIDFPMGE